MTQTIIPRPDPTRCLLLIDDEAAAQDDSAYAPLAAALEQLLPITVRVCFIGDAQRSVRRELQRVADAGAIDVVLLPLFRGSARQQLLELDSLARWARAHWPGLQCARGGTLWSEAHLLALLERSAEQALDGLAALPEQATALLIAAPGGEPDANADWYARARRLWERRRAGLVEPVFTSGTQPDLPAGVERAQRLGARRIVVLPTLLLDGPRLAALATDVRAAASARPDLELRLAAPLGRVPSVAAVAAQRFREALRAAANGEQPATAGAHGHSHGIELGAQSALLPPRYRNGAPISAAPMAAAELVVGPDGRVAWDRMWGDFCDLALAGGPPHRGTLLEPVDPNDVRADPAGYVRVLDELARGLGMVTGLEVVSDAAPGWIGLRCTDDDMARWMLQAIVVENVAVRREGCVLLLPAGPAFRIDGEIKNVVTVVAKTFHYWTEHRAE